MGVRDDCRHYLARTASNGDVSRRCRVGAATEIPFACPDGCVFFEPRPLMDGGWARAPSQPLSNTADGLANLPPPKRRRGKGRR